MTTADGGTAGAAAGSPGESTGGSPGGPSGGSTGGLGSATAYLVLPGRAVVVGKQPDGDSVRFVPDQPALLGQLVNGARVRASPDGSVQLRFDGVDAPELHYQGAAQPQGAAARDQLLTHLGFTDVTYTGGGESVATASPASVPVVVLSRMAEVHGRPVAVVFTGQAATDLAASAGTWVELDAGLLGESVNCWEAATGVVYPLVYTSTAPGLRAVFVGAARTAAQARAGVWAQDATAGFPVTDPAALGPGGVLIWPKLFRRAIDYFREHAAGQDLPQWLAATPTEDDDVYVTTTSSDPAGDPGSVPSSDPVALHTLLTQSGDQAALSVDVLDLVIVER